MTQRDPQVAAETTGLTAAIAQAVAHLSLEPEVWENFVIQARTDLLDLTQRAVFTIGEGGLHTVGFQLRAQELALRIEILETLLTQIQNHQPAE